MKKLTESKISKIKILHDEGKSERVIAKKLGCSRGAVWYHLNK
jgi:biotin operon repressor